MSATAIQGQAERAEFEAVLSSGIFSRSPSLATFLRFVCERYFDGNTNGLKEYCIAVEALKRPPDFDQKKDAIVRVEAYRLRRRLADYYQGEGAAHTIQIQIPSGQYAPRFVYKADLQAIRAGETQEFISQLNLVSEPQENAKPSRETESPAAQTPPERGLSSWFVWGGVGLLAVAIAVLVVWRNASRPGSAPAALVSEVWQGPSSIPVPTDFRMLAGYHGLPFTDRQGRIWSPDSYYRGGVSVPLPNHRSFQGLPDPDFASAQRIGDFEYNIPVAAGTYEIHLHFLEAQVADAEGPGAKLFNVFLNGNLALDHIDPLSDAGAPRRLTSRVLSNVTPAKDGGIHLKFAQQGTKPELVGLEILATTPGKVRPVRIVAATRSVTDAAGQRWMADEYSVGGTFVARRGIAQNSGLENLYTGERYGNFSYHIPLPPGRYRVELFFAEGYFGDKLLLGHKQDGFSARIFNVFADGLTLLRNFNVIKEAGGSRRAISKTFENLEPDAQGKIVLEFVPVVNYAEVNAIEVLQMN